MLPSDYQLSLFQVCPVNVAFHPPCLWSWLEEGLWHPPTAKKIFQSKSNWYNECLIHQFWWLLSIFYTHYMNTGITFCRIIKTFLGQWLDSIAVLKITAGQRTPSCQDDHFGMPVILIWHLGKWQEKYIFTPFRFNRASIYFPFMFLLVRLLRSSHYRVIFNILTGQKKERVKTPSNDFSTEVT